MKPTKENKKRKYLAFLGLHDTLQISYLHAICIYKLFIVVGIGLFMFSLCVQVNAHTHTHISMFLQHNLGQQLVRKILKSVCVCVCKLCCLKARLSGESLDSQQGLALRLITTFCPEETHKHILLCIPLLEDLQRQPHKTRQQFVVH